MFEIEEESEGMEVTNSDEMIRLFFITTSSSICSLFLVMVLSLDVLNVSWKADIKLCIKAILIFWFALICLSWSLFGLCAGFISVLIWSFTLLIFDSKEKGQYTVFHNALEYLVCGCFFEGYGEEVVDDDTSRSEE